MTTRHRATDGTRIAFLDNVRTAMIVLVVLYHSGIVYESSGLFASFWIVDDPATNPWIAFYLSMLSLLYLTLVTFRRWFNEQGRMGAQLSENSYAVYILHVPVLGVIALLLLQVGIPSLAKYVVLAASTYVLTNLMALGYRDFLRPKLLASILWGSDRRRTEGAASRLV